MIFLTETVGIKFFGLQHILIIFMVIGLCVWFPLFARRRFKSRSATMGFYGVFRSLSVLEFSAQFFFRMTVGEF